MNVWQAIAVCTVMLLVDVDAAYRFDLDAYAVFGILTALTGGLIARHLQQRRLDDGEEREPGGDDGGGESRPSLTPSPAAHAPQPSVPSAPPPRCSAACATAALT